MPDPRTWPRRAAKAIIFAAKITFAALYLFSIDPRHRQQLIEEAHRRGNLDV